MENKVHHNMSTHIEGKETEAVYLRHAGQLTHQLELTHSLVNDAFFLPLLWINLQCCRLASHIFFGKLGTHYSEKKERIRKRVETIKKYLCCATIADQSSALGNNMSIKREKIKTWFVTGASSGIGHEICRQLLERGYNVIAVARRVPNFTEPNALCLSVDVTKPETIDIAVKRGIERFGRIDVLSNNAGMLFNATFEEETLEHMRLALETNFLGTFNTMHALLPHFRKNKNGTIINNSSQSGLAPRAYGSAYCSSKYAVEAISGVVWHEARSFCRTMCVEFGSFPSTGIGKREIRRKTQVDCYKVLSNFYKPLICNFRNDLSIAIHTIIDTVENEIMPRRLMLGKDCLQRVCAEIESISDDYLFSSYRGGVCSVANNAFTEESPVHISWLRKVASLSWTWCNLQLCRFASHVFPGRLGEHYTAKKRHLRERITSVKN